VNAPRSWPNISDSTRSRGSAALLTVTNGLLPRALCAADKIFGLSLHPEVRWIVGEIGEQRDERNFRHSQLHTLCDGTVEVGYDGKNQVRGMQQPVPMQQLYDPLVPHSYHALKNSQEWRRKTGPAFT